MTNDVPVGIVSRLVQCYSVEESWPENDLHSIHPKTQDRSLLWLWRMTGWPRPWFSILVEWGQSCLQCLQCVKMPPERNRWHG